MLILCLNCYTYTYNTFKGSNLLIIERTNKSSARLKQLPEEEGKLAIYSAEYYPLRFTYGEMRVTKVVKVTLFFVSEIPLHVLLCIFRKTKYDFLVNYP